jgi:hypothetical protein
MRVSSRAQAQVEESILSLFQDIPSLCGFTVQARPSGLELADIGLFPAPADDEAKLIHEEIRETISQLIDERPEARNLVTGRTFARALH